MPTILMGWEYGGGLGHAARLLPIARALRERGHTVTFAMKNPNALATLTEADEFRSVTAPVARILKRNSGTPFQAGSYADILAVHGFNDEQCLFDTLQQWEAILDSDQPDLIVCEHAPALSLAAFGNYRVVHVGTGFTCPPTDGDQFPPFAESVASVDQAEMLQVVNRGQQRRNAVQLAKLTEVLATGRQFVMTWPELDPYQTVRRKTPVGPIEPLPENRGVASQLFPGSPLGSTELSFFAYLSADMPSVEMVMLALAKSGFRGRTYFRDATPQQLNMLREAGITVDCKPPDVPSMLGMAGLVVHHGGAGLSSQALAAGCPQILLPRFVEQKLIGEALQSLNVGVSYHGQVRLSSVISGAKRLCEAALQTHAATLADKILSRQTVPDPLEQVVEHCEAQLTES